MVFEGRKFNSDTSVHTLESSLRVCWFFVTIPLSAFSWYHGTSWRVHMHWSAAAAQPQMTDVPIFHIFLGNFSLKVSLKYCSSQIPATDTSSTFTASATVCRLFLHAAKILEATEQWI